MKSARAAMPATARAAENAAEPLPAATNRTIAKIAPQAAPRREGVMGMVTRCSFRGRLRYEGRYEPGTRASSAATAKSAPSPGGTRFRRAAEAPARRARYRRANEGEVYGRDRQPPRADCRRRRARL